MSASAPEIDIRHVARLARLNLTDAEAAVFGRDLSRVLAHFAALGALDLSDVPPFSHPSPDVASLRPDVPGPTLDRAVALAQAPAHDGAAFLVPKVV
jgi:aspartyl-tRNA(Asn)/glutamyl-tRNA(Gln) amidotransferase subunit C